MITRRKLLLGGLLLTGAMLRGSDHRIAAANQSANKSANQGAEQTTNQATFPAVSESTDVRQTAGTSAPDGQIFDVAVVGGGVAGLQAALTLGRACRKVIVLDSKEPRNTGEHPLHNFIGRDGVPQAQLLQEARDQLKQYDITLCYDKVSGSSKVGGAFSLATASGLNIKCKKVLLATGVKDQLPPIDGLAALWGKAVLYCPYCSGWEVKGKGLAVLGRGEAAAYAAMTLTGWSSDLMLLTDGPSQISQRRLDDLKKLNIPVFEEKIAAVKGQSALDSIVLADGKQIKRCAIFVQPSENHQSAILTSLGARQNDWGVPTLDARGQTSVPGVYVAGDASGKPFQAIGAAADGASVAFALNRAIIFEGLQSRGIALN